MKCLCCPKANIVSYIQCFGGGVFPLWFCEDHVDEGTEIATRWDKELVPIKKMTGCACSGTTKGGKMTFKIGDRTFKKYASAKW